LILSLSLALTGAVSAQLRKGQIDPAKVTVPQWHYQPEYAYDYNGFLRWAYDAWPADPVRDARHTFWPAGDCFLVYPGANSCIRFEKLREGIVDYEKILILRELALKSKDQNVKKLMKDLEAHLATLTEERDYSKRNYNDANITETLRKGNKMIDDLSSELGK
jgi:hypothetical protein